ncbi:MAG: amidohydrolase family protein [Acidobacteria bacterium]|nr:amidohydrolase family protein [Acidobacteriota bacterium]
MITALGDSALPEAVIVIDGGKIQSISGRGASHPSDASVIDLPGRFIIPGLIDSHTHYEEWMGEAFLNHGVTTAMAVGGNFGKKKEASQKAGRTPRIFDTAGRAPISPSMKEEQVRETVREWLKAKPDFAHLGDYNEKFSQVYRWAADEIHRRAGLLVFGHTENAPESIRAGQDVVEHMWGFIIPLMSPREHDDFQRGRYLHWSLFLRDWDKLDQEIREAVAQGAYLNPTFVYELGSLSSAAAKHEREIYQLYSEPSLMAYYPQNIAQSLLQKQRQIRNFSGKYENLVMLSNLTTAEREEFDRGYRLAGQFLKRWVRAGGKVQAGTDTISGGTPGLNLHHEMELLVEAGLTPMQALQSATIWSAELIAGKKGMLGPPKIGMIAEGAFADLVILSANPLEDIGNTRKIERVMKGGNFVRPGYDPAYFSFTRPPRKIAMATPVPEISEVAPHTVSEGNPEFEIVVRGVGFGRNSVVRVDGIGVPTTFVNPRTLKARIPAAAVGSATPNPFDAPGPDQYSGVFGDPTVPITVHNPPPEGGTSNSVSLRIRAKWMGLEDEVR